MAKNKLAINTGLGKIAYSILGEDGTYSAPKVMGELISVAVTPSENTQSLWAGDSEILVDSSIGVEGTFGVPTLTNEAMCDLFGYKMGSNGELIYDSSATRPFVALMFVQNNYGDVQDYVTLWKCRLNLAGVQGNTKNDSVSYGTREFGYKCLIPEDKVYMSVASSDEEDFKDSYAENFFITAPVKPVVKAVAGK